jgi:chemotaxis family two-component system sensor kinase Cph1
MQRLIGEVFEMSRVKAGLGLGLSLVPGDLARFVKTLVEDAQTAYPDSDIRRESSSTLMAGFDADRMAQVVSNLLSNARNHGLVREPIRVRLAVISRQIELSVFNVAPPIPETKLGTLFEPFKPGSLDNARNPGVLGWGFTSRTRSPRPMAARLNTVMTGRESRSR